MQLNRLVFILHSCDEVLHFHCLSQRSCTERFACEQVIERSKKLSFELNLYPAQLMALQLRELFKLCLSKYRGDQPQDCTVPIPPAVTACRIATQQVNRATQ